MARAIALNAKLQRPSACNSIETLLIHEEFAVRELSDLASAFHEANIELRGDHRSIELVPSMNTASSEDWDTEYNDYIMNVRVVSGLEEALAHIRAHSTKHSECIITEDDRNALRFLNEVDASAVSHQRGLPTVSSLVSARRLASALRSCMPVVRWDSQSLPRLTTCSYS
jgi:glutamate-5-semialdehyde dehydrogenase